MLVLIAAASASLAVAAPRAGGERDARTIVAHAVDDLYRGASSVGTLEMHVKTSRWERTLELQQWSQGTDRSLIRVLSPKKERGVTTLKVGKDVWNYLPKVDRVIKVPASMMSASWMGSHFTNDDLVHESRFADDYELAVRERPTAADARWLIEATPKPDAPVVWGKVTLAVSAGDLLPIEAKFFDGRGALVRTIRYSDVEDVGGRKIPMRMTLIPADKPGESTEVVWKTLRFDVNLPASTFSLQALKR